MPDKVLNMPMCKEVAAQTCFTKRYTKCCKNPDKYL